VLTFPGETFTPSGGPPRPAVIRRSFTNSMQLLVINT
jgi:hypothetical protein